MRFDPEAPPVAGLTQQANVLVTGASSGIGLAMVAQLLDNRHVARVVAVSRSASRSDALLELLRVHGRRLQLTDVDLTCDADLASLDTQLRDVDSLHLVINAAGVLHGASITPEKSIEQVRRASLEQVFGLNAFAPLLLAQSLLSRLCRGQPAVFASLSARVGSIGDNRAGGWYAYRASKAAQNQLMRTFAIEWRRRNPLGICLLLHPGTVDTPLSAPFQSGMRAGQLFDSGRAAAQQLQIIASATPADSGRFLAWDGSDVPW